MKLRTLVAIAIVVGVLIVSGCCVCCIPTGTTRSQGMANEYARTGQSQASPGHVVLLPAYAGDVGR